MSTEQEENIELRYTMEEDESALRQWLMDPSVSHGFPMENEREASDGARHWISFARYKSSLTATIAGKPVGIATLCLMPYRKISHHCLVSIIVSHECRGRGVGTLLLNNLIHLAKSYFNIEVLYLEVYEGNPALSLYKRFGFVEIGKQRHFMKDGDKYVAKIIMERVL